MEPITIIMVVVGVILLICSCFVTKEDKAAYNYDELIKRLAKRELTDEETDRIRQTVDSIISEKTEDIIVKTDNYLSQVANEKIMSVDEFSKQILERLDKNNSDVMFLYNMVTETKEELKTEIANAKKAEEKLRSATATTKAEERDKPDNAKSVMSQKKATSPKKPEVKKEVTEGFQKDDIAELLAATMTKEQEPQVEVDLPKERILELHKKGKTVKEISRELGMGQGEVKLVIDLYGA